MNILNANAVFSNSGANIKETENGKTEKVNTSASAGETFSSIMDKIKQREAGFNALKGAGAKLSAGKNLSEDILTPFKIESPVPADKNAEPEGTARNFFLSQNPVINSKKIDKTSELYKQALELESYFVKILTDSMRKTLSGKTLYGEETFAEKMYKDMMYDELNRTLTKNAGFGLAGQIYLQLSK